MKTTATPELLQPGYRVEYQHVSGYLSSFLFQMRDPWCRTLALPWYSTELSRYMLQLSMTTQPQSVGTV